MSAGTVVVTGATGFLGKHLIALLTSSGYTVLPVSRQNGIDVCDLDSLQQLPAFDALIHLAAQTFVPDSYNHTAAFYTTNIIGTLNCLEICKKNKAHMIFASSYVYGPPRYLPVDEQHPLNSWNPYATSKIIGEQLCGSYHKEFQLNIDILRIFNIYGPGQNPVFLIPKIMEGLLKGQLNLETGSPKRDFVYVTDVCKAILSCLQKKKIESSELNIFNIGTGKSYSVEEIIKMAETVCGRQVPVYFSEEKRKTEVPDVRSDFSRIQSVTGWMPETAMEEGLKLIFNDRLKKE